jgi:phage recombination protein Bet
MSEVNNKIAIATGFTSEQVAIIKNTVAKNVSDLELAFFLTNAKDLNLSPFNKEIWCYKDHQNNLIMFAGRDGFLKKAQQDNRWNGISSADVRANDTISIDYPNGVVHHSPQVNKDRGEIVGAYAICKPKGCELATIEYVEFKTYSKGKFVWASHPADMIKKVAEIRALKKAYGISGLQSEYEFTVQDDIVKPINSEPKPDKEYLRIKEHIENAKTKDELKMVADVLPPDLIDEFNKKLVALK